MNNMTLGHTEDSRAFAVWFKDLHLWSVGAFTRLEWGWPQEYIRPLSVALCRRMEEVDRRQYSLDDLQIVTLHFDGTIEPRDRAGRNGFKGKLFFAHPDDVVYSKIDVRNGAIGIVPQEMPKAVVSSEYPVYKVFPDVALPGYIKLLFRTSYFRRAINGMISGTSGRKRVQPEQIEALKAPVPPLEIQRAIVAQWEKAQEKRQIARASLEKLTEDPKRYSL